MKISDMLSIRANVNESTMWLSVIFSWLTPYSWWVDASIIFMVSVVNQFIVDRNYNAYHKDVK